MSNEMKDAGIEHVIVLMLENRGFDHVLGWLYDKDEKPTIVTRESDNRPFIGLSTLTPEQLKKLANPSPIEGQDAIQPIKGARSPAIPEFNPGEHFVHIMAQIWGAPEQVNWKDPDERASKIYELYKKYDDVPMTGYLKDFANVIQHEAYAKPTANLVTQILETYLPEQLPVLNGLAKHYAVSDEWFCSVPSQTNANRAFSIAGTSRGLVNNNYYDASLQSGFRHLKPAGAILGGSHADRLPQTTQSLFGLLSTFNKDWKVYWQSTWPPRNLAATDVQYLRCMFPELDSPVYDANFSKINPVDSDNELFKDAREGLLPAISWIEPKWGGGPLYRSGSAEHVDDKLKQITRVGTRLVGTDMHPSCDTTVAEDFIDNLYSAISKSPKWNNTLFIITFDENGGTYDHIPPPGSKPRSEKNSIPSEGWIPTPTNLDHTPKPVPTAKEKLTDPTTGTEFGFQFDQLGIRVPTILISPKLNENIIFRSTTDVPYDHTSIIASLLEWQEISRKYWFFGDRVNKAPTFNKLFSSPKSYTKNPRQDKNYSKSIKKSNQVGKKVIFNQPYCLRYLGNPWAEPPLFPKIYFGGYEWSTVYLGFFPTLTSIVDDAKYIMLLKHDEPKKTGSIINRSSINICYATPPQLMKVKFPKIVVSDNYTNAFCAINDNSLHDKWEIRLMNSRDGDDPITLSDHFCLISTAYKSLDFNFSSSSLDVKGRFDPYQRLVPDPKDPKYLTTRAGVWGAWKLEEIQENQYKHL